MRPGPQRSAPTVEVVVPAHDEAAIVGPNLRRLHAHLGEHLGVGWRITVAENASGDATLAEARRVAHELEGIRVTHREHPGRGGAVREAWRASDAEVLCYLDLDLSTDLAALDPLLAPLLAGDADLSVGTRLAPGADLRRRLHRDLLSRGYNALLRRVFANRFTDAQCGFKALRREVADGLLAAVDDDAWFFDTELLLAAEERGLRVHEVPVRWVDDAESTVRILPTVLEDLRGVARVRRERRARRTAPTGAPEHRARRDAA
ncbi:MAG: glycosyltransferase [Acidimicrobiales bacterium]|nr:glycosyltransferase [Acidimicrobiales bacterium]